MTESGDWYDLPELYDFLYDVDTEREARFLLRVAREHGLIPRRILEAACGSGRLLRAFARRGYQVAGFDRNAKSLAYARRRLRAEGLAARLSRQDLAEFRYSNRFDLAHCLLSSFKYLQRERDALSHLHCVANSLRSGGIYALGLHLSDPVADTDASERWRRISGKNRVEVELRTRRPDFRRRREQVEVELRAHYHGETVYARDRWWWRTWTDAQLIRLLAKVSELELVGCYDFDFRPRQLADSRLDKILILRRA